MTLRLGIDIDGCLANFNKGYRDLFIKITGVDGFRGETDPPCWNYHQHYGYSDAEFTEVWKRIAESDTFWADLDPLPGAESFLRWLYWRQSTADVYFITQRLGQNVKHQTERWLTHVGFPHPTVLIAPGSKGDIADGLKLTHVLDDKPENLFVLPANVRRCLKLTRYNQWGATGELIVPLKGLPDFCQLLMQEGK